MSNTALLICHDEQHSSARIGVDAADAATHCLPATSKQRGTLWENYQRCNFIICHDEQHSSAHIGGDTADAATHCLPVTSKKRGTLWGNYQRCNFIICHDEQHSRSKVVRQKAGVECDRPAIFLSAA